jgi:hypothetical protein
MDSLPQSRLLQSHKDILKSGALAVVPLANSLTGREIPSFFMP